MITVLIPDRGTTGYTLYAAGKALGKPVHFPEDGGFHIAFEGTVMLFYTFDGARRKHRKAYVVTEGEGGHEIELECVDRKTRFVFMAEGRKVDLLKRLMHYIGGDRDVYLFGERFWRELTRLVDRNFNGKESSLTRVAYKKLVDAERARIASRERRKAPEFAPPKEGARPSALTLIRAIK